MGDFLTGGVAVQFKFILGIEWLVGVFGIYVFYRLLKFFRRG